MQYSIVSGMPGPTDTADKKVPMGCEAQGNDVLAGSAISGYLRLQDNH